MSWVGVNVVVLIFPIFHSTYPVVSDLIGLPSVISAGIYSAHVNTTGYSFIQSWCESESAQITWAIGHWLVPESFSSVSWALG
ncbi:hypothetical protein PM082_017875 [Marasmius tenuissimus]|nr:hypothetical protein PM082_017875 [Marasmius tenuissimus]